MLGALFCQELRNNLCYLGTFEAQERRAERSNVNDGGFDWFEDVVGNHDLGWKLHVRVSDKLQDELIMTTTRL